MPEPKDVQYGHPMFYKLVEEIRDLHERKNRQYATQDDPLGNFRRTGQIISKMLKPGINPTLASCLAFMSKQVDGVYEIFGESKTDTVDSLEDKLLDIAVYSIIGMILVREGRQKSDPELDEISMEDVLGARPPKCDAHRLSISASLGYRCPYGCQTAEVKDGPYCENCDELAEYRQDQGKMFKPLYWCEYCANVKLLDFDKLTRMEKL